MTYMVNGVVNTEMSKLAGTKLDATKQLGQLDSSSVAEKLAKLKRQDVVDFGHTPQRDPNGFEVSEYTLSSGEKVVEFSSKTKVYAQGDTNIDFAINRLMHTLSELQKGQHEFMQQELERGNANSLGEQYALNRQYWNNAFADMRKNDIGAFEAYISLDDTLEDIARGGEWELGNFNLDDWFEVQGQNWESVTKYSNISDGAKEIIYNRAREKGLIE